MELLTRFLDLSRRALQVIGGIAVLILVLVIVANGYRQKDPHDYRWFMTQACPQSYVAFLKSSNSKPLAPSMLFEPCLNEIKHKGESND